MKLHLENILYPGVSVLQASHSESLVESRNRRNLENGGKPGLNDNNTDTEEDFFDDPLPTSPGYKPFSK